MKKVGIILVVVAIILGIGLYMIDPDYEYITTYLEAHTFTKDEGSKNQPYYVKTGHKVNGYFNSLDEAVEVANKHKRSVVIDNNTNDWVYNNYLPFIILTEHGVQDFETLESAIYYANRNDYRQVYWKGNKDLIIDYDEILPDSTKALDVPVIKQYPELPRGCEVTSLAMMLQYSGVNVDKLELAQKVKKDETPYYKDGNGKIKFGNPYNGFVGDMYNIKNNGYGVYHGPITELAKGYVSENAIDLTGLNINQILSFVAKGMPVWVVANTTYKPLEESSFEMWHTPTGIVKVTYKEHAVVITGYTDKYIYINDPFYSKGNIKIDKEKFIEAWMQMGQQAVVVHK